jgi:hypothetical protein
MSAVERWPPNRKTKVREFFYRNAIFDSRWDDSSDGLSARTHDGAGLAITRIVLRQVGKCT